MRSACRPTAARRRRPRTGVRGPTGRPPRRWGLIATHVAGPTWQARDGSRVVGRRVGEPETVDASAIPWLLLSAAATTAGPDGDRLAGTTFIQRTATTGGLTPNAGACHAGTATTVEEVPYTADYHCWKATGR